MRLTNSSIVFSFKAMDRVLTRQDVMELYCLSDRTARRYMATLENMGRLHPETKGKAHTKYYSGEEVILAFHQMLDLDPVPKPTAEPRQAA